MSAGDRAPEPGESTAANDPPRQDVAALYSRYHARLRRHAMSKLPKHLRTEADVPLMDVFRRLTERAQAGTLPRPESWEAYLLGAVTNACRDLVRAARHHVQLDQDDPELAELDRNAPRDPTADDVIARVDEAATVARVRDALDNLDPRSRTIVIGKIWNEQSDRALGTELGITGQRVGQLYKEALQNLREAVTRLHD